MNWKTRFGALLVIVAGIALGCGTPVITPDSGADARADGATDIGIDIAMDANDGAMCATGQTRCTDACSDLQRDPANCGTCGHACADTEGCVAGQCQLRCPTGQVACNGSCVSLQTDNANCGACGTACVAGQLCSMGACATSCGAPLTQCGSGSTAYCADTRTDNANCGVCGTICAAGQACVAGACTATCPSNSMLCTAGSVTTCANTQTDNANCGGCGVMCPAGQVCSAGACATTCGGGTTQCGSGATAYCANTQTNNQNCGACGTICPAGQVCSAGACATTCGGGLLLCGAGATAYCANTQTDNANCGGCGTICPAGQACVTGACATTCPSSQTLCTAGSVSTCTNTQSDNANCGACGTVCPSGQVCSAGACATTCGGGLSQCGTGAAAFCANTQTDNANCGTCGTTCPAGQVCSNGACGTTCGGGLALCGSGATAYCANTQSDNANCGTCGTLCPAGQACVTGACTTTCPASQTLCTSGAVSTCTNTQSDNANCGMCGVGCAAGQVCSMGACATTCGAGLMDCNGSCRNVATDPANCGACGTTCPTGPNATPFCALSSCGLTCAIGFGNCNGIGADGCETSTAFDPNNCTGCGIVCNFANAASTCARGCVLGACNPGFANCDANAANGCESNTQTDDANCGACGTVCPGGQVCSMGVCTTTCAAGLMTCSGSCANTANDPSNCGSCGNVCPTRTNATPVCAASACAQVCNAGFVDCDGNAANGCEIAPQSDANNCGGCGQACSGNHIAARACTAGSCSGACSAGFADCNGNRRTDGCEIDTQTDVNNCGACGNVCNAPNGAAACVAGVCTVASCAAGFADCNANPADGCEVNTNTSASNCGACGNVCSNSNGTGSCLAGSCAIACNSGFANCDNNAGNGCEIATTNDVSNCGLCGRVCNAANGTPTCSNSVCAIASCTAPFRDCDNIPTNGCETNNATDVFNCGGCGVACSMNNIARSCGGGVCNGTCNAGFGDCNGNKQSDGCETNTTNNAANCGACGAVCVVANGTAACASSVCTVGTCNTGFANCDGNAGNGCETNTTNNVNNCGACGNVCSPANGGAACAGGICTTTSCNAGFANCDGNGVNGCEINVTNNVTNCGACGVACSTNNISRACAGGSCSAGTCNAGFADCNGNKQTDGCEINITNDLSNCGGCGTVCSTNNISRACAGGSCGAGICNAGFADCNGNKQADGCETNVNTNVNNCGGCGVVCSTNHITASCTAATCNGTCATGFADCDNNRQSNGCEINTNTDANNCGGCGIVCGGGMSCNAGLCVAPSCNAIHAANALAPSGVYHLLTGGVVWDAYCDMVTNGGGWTLILKQAGNSAAFATNSGMWTSGTLLNTTSTDLTRTEAKFHGFVDMPVTSVMIGFDNGAATISYAAFNTAGPVIPLLNTFGGGAFVPFTNSYTFAARQSLLGLNAAFAVQPNCNQAGFNVPMAGATGPGVRVGLAGNQEGDCNSNDSVVGLGAQHVVGGCSYGATPIASAGSNCSCGPCVNFAGFGVADPAVTQAFGYLFIR